MENCCYEEIRTKKTEGLDNKSEETWAPLMRQTLICSGIWTCFFMFGLAMGAPTVFIPQIRKAANSTDVISTEMASWLNAVFAFGSVPWIIILPILANRFGRVLPYRLISIVSLAAVIVFYCSNSIIHILISEIMQSIIGAGQMTLFIIILSETTSPQYRGVFLTMKSASYYWGVWVSNAIGTFFHWKKICLIQILCSVYIIVSSFIIRESPYWLASKNRIRESVLSLRWLKGYTEAADKELESMLNMEEVEKYPPKTKGKDGKVLHFIKIFAMKEIYKPILFCALMTNLYYSTGKLVCTMYAIDIIRKITSSESVAYTVMLILDGITVFGMYVGCGLSKILKRKTLLIFSTSIGTTFLFILSIYLYLVKFSLILENKYVTASFLMCYSIGISCGPMILCSSICSELLPLKFRSTVACTVAIYDRTVMGISLKISPAIFVAFGTHGAFLFFGIMSSFFLTIVYKYLPETKDRTLQEIARLMKNETDRVLADQKINLVKNLNDLS